MGRACVQGADVHRDVRHEGIRAGCKGHARKEDEARRGRHGLCWWFSAEGGSDRRARPLPGPRCPTATPKPKWGRQRLGANPRASEA
eukprot:10721629-Alexandrium_andersonii.AAC.1